MRRRLLAFALALVVAPACGGDDVTTPDEPAASGTHTGASCDPSLSYESFGRAFMETYCTRCHASTLTGAARHSAPPDHDFDLLEKIVQYAEAIDEYAGAGPRSENDFMPPSGAMPSPSLQERRLLAAWLACDPVI